MVFSFLKGQFIDVIEWTDSSRDTMVYRFERYGNEIKYGAKLTVREGQMAVFVHEGQLADVFEPGMYMLETNNMPIMTSLQHWDHGFSSPFKSEIYFVNMRRFTGLKWGTQNPVMLRDPEFGPLRLRAFGSYAVRVQDAATFLREIVGTDGDFTQEKIAGQIRNIVVQKVSRVLAASGIPALDMAANTKDLSDVVSQAIAPTLAEYGLSMPELYIENISLPPEVEKVLDQRTSMGIVGDLNKFTQFSAAQAIAKAAEGGDSGMGAGLGAGMGMGMGMGMAQAMGQAMGQTTAGGHAAPPPPPPPVSETMWHIAENGQTRGPIPQSALAGQITRDSLVWREGQSGWLKAGDLPELARLFAAMPPPPPPAG
jgi:membrane protease subunit (stomatin/prohibitin family)